MKLKLLRRYQIVLSVWGFLDNSHRHQCVVCIDIKFMKIVKNEETFVSCIITGKHVSKTP